MICLVVHRQNDRCQLETHDPVGQASTSPAGKAGMNNSGRS
jgi:hypothetical protein